MLPANFVWMWVLLNAPRTETSWGFDVTVPCTWRTLGGNALMKDGLRMVKSLLPFEVWGGVAGTGENKLKTPKEKFPNLAQEFLAKSNPRRGGWFSLRRATKP